MDLNLRQVQPLFFGFVENYAIFCMQASTYHARSVCRSSSADIGNEA